MLHGGLRIKPMHHEVTVTYRRPKVLPHRSQAQENGFSFVCVLSCLWTCSTRLIQALGFCRCVQGGMFDLT